jgi:hypothetical protein
MTVAREYQVPTIEAAARPEWIRPSVQRLDAGSAEDQAGTQPDQLNVS